MHGRVSHAMLFGVLGAACGLFVYKVAGGVAVFYLMLGVFLAAAICALEPKP